jgi:uncharacterized membrane protein (UPF0127 family)
MVHPGMGSRAIAMRWLRAATIAVLATAGVCVAAPSGGGATGSDGGRDAVREARRAEVRFPSGRTFLAEIADTPQRLARGYMFRRDIGEADAMIFAFPESDVHPFWMKNTLVPLDLVGMDEAFKVLYIEPSAPPCKADPVRATLPRRARYVLEVRGGSGRAPVPGDALKISFPEGTD